MHKYIIRIYNWIIIKYLKYLILAKHCIELPYDGPLVIRNMLEQL